ncbi:hypothetical protein JKP88DRAFT_156894 [Tribonema minus]|uniref:Uncharacterized protein n=1 Tax=Tribonema minus TaxID=303371 RepID=A0A835Z3L4_9STRA|nr:hypothetical protein JKP88DRAFT_156894 [Tribonema minus]
MDLDDVTAAIRVDTATNKGSVIDVIKIVQSCNASDASTYCKRLLDDIGTDLGTRCVQLRINSKGRLTPCADAKTLVEIVWSLPGKAAREFRRQSAANVCRVLGGDLSIVQEVEARHHALQQTEGGRAAQKFLLEDSESSVGGEMISGLPLELALANETQKSAYFEARMREEAAIATKKARAQFAVEGYELLRSMGAADHRDCITFSDAVRRAVTDGGGAAVVEARALAADDPTIPTPQCDPFYRGEEISMHTVAHEMRVKIPEQGEGRIGKRMKALYTERYGDAAAANIPTRNIEFRGQIWPANSYWARDADLMKRAVQSVL